MTNPVIAQIFFNPNAGNYSSSRTKAIAKAFRDIGAEPHLTPSIDAEPCITPDATHICIIGGDGTVRHVAAAVARANRTLPIAIYPAGTINLLAREAPMDRRPGALAQALVHGCATRPHHPASAGSEMFFACASVGPDSYAVASVSSRLKRKIGRLAYAVAFARLLWAWPRPQLTVRTNHGEWDCEAIYVAKGRHYAGPWSFAPHARVGDGLLHVIALRTARRRDFLRFCWQMLTRADPANNSNTIAFSCTALSLRCEQPMPLQGDGDIIAMCPVDIKVHDTPIQIC